MGPYGQHVRGSQGWGQMFRRHEMTFLGHQFDPISYDPRVVIGRGHRWINKITASKKEQCGGGPQAGRGKVYAAWSASVFFRNFGDTMTPWILWQCLGMRPIQVHLRDTQKLMTIGSVLNFAMPGDFIWGSGTIREERVDASGARIFGLRGPRSAALIQGAEVPALYGDPASLLPYLLPIEPIEKKGVVVVPHYVDLPVIYGPTQRAEFLKNPSVEVLDVQERDWRALVARIASAEVVLSSSLHGIIVAAAYGVACVWVGISDRIAGGHHKFLDYFEGQGRDTNRFDWSLGISRLVEKASGPATIDVKGLQDGLSHLRQA